MAQLFTRSAAALAALFMVSWATQASAALISHISWDVTGGQFGFFSSGGLAVGPITMGSVDWTPPGGSVSTPVLCCGFSGGTWTLSLSGPSGFFRMGGGPGGSSLSVYANSFSAYLYGVPNPRSGPSLAALVPNAATFSGALGILSTGTVEFGKTYPYLSGEGYVIGYSGGVGGVTFTHKFILGNEVRTFVPEPNRGTLLSVGLVSLGVFAATRRTQARCAGARELPAPRPGSTR